MSDSDSSGPVDTADVPADVSAPAHIAASTSASLVRKFQGNPARFGRKATGLYPQINRTVLAEITGRHITTITGILHGRWKISLSLAVQIAEAIGISVEQLNRDLEQKQLEYAKERVSRINASLEAKAQAKRERIAEAKAALKRKFKR